MSARSLKDQFLRDLKASWQKSLVLGVLLLVGLIFWVPPLVRAVLPKNPQSAAAKSAGTTPPSQTASAPNAPTATPGGSATGATLAAVTWKNADRILQTDPLVQSADVAAIRGNPFRIDHRQFPPPILFADDPPPPKAIPVVAGTAATETAARVLPPELVLRSTILGANRRAAYINRRLYFEGARIEVAGETFLLASVESRKVVLQADGESFELTIPAPSESAAGDDSTATGEPPSTGGAASSTGPAGTAGTNPAGTNATGPGTATPQP